MNAYMPGGPFDETVSFDETVRVAAIPRLIAGLSYSFVAIGAALSAWMIWRTLEAMRMAENAGIGAVTGGMSESTMPVVVCLYLAILCGFGAIIAALVRLNITTTKASPPAWFFAAAAVPSLLLIACLWLVESTLLQALYPGSGSVVEAASRIRLLSLITMIGAPIVLLLLLIVCVVPFSIRSRPGWGAVLMLVFIEGILIIATVLFQMRMSWLWQASQAESLG